MTDSRQTYYYTERRAPTYKAHLSVIGLGITNTQDSYLQQALLSASGIEKSVVYICLISQQGKLLLMLELQMYLVTQTSY